MVETDNYQLAKKILAVFSDYGFQAISMQHVSEATGIPMQSVCERFGSTEKCYDWCVHTCLVHLYVCVFSIVPETFLPLPKTLQDVSELLKGNIIDETIAIINGPYGMEIIDTTLAITQASSKTRKSQLNTRLDALLNHCKLNANADDIAFVLVCNGRGLLLEESSRKLFFEAMKLVIDSIKP